MTREQLKQHQVDYGLTNAEIARLVGRSSQTVSNWRTGRQAIPAYVAKILTPEKELI